jgi:hypothetical protein
MHYMGGHLEKNLSLYICPIITTKFVWLTINVENLLVRTFPSYLYPMLKITNAVHYSP